MTSLFSNNKLQKIVLSKGSVRINAIGSVDELNSYLGVIIAESEDSDLQKALETVQGNLLTVGSILGGSNLKFTKTNTTSLEKEIDEIDKKIEPLKNFIYPGGTKVSAKIQYARSLSRRAERAIVELDTIESVKPQIIIYINRLSDYLFTLARYQNKKNGFEERIWKVDG